MAKKQHNPALKKGRPKWKKNEELYLWSKCAGRCERCNKLLIEDPLSLAKVKIGQLAHIIAHSDEGPRADAEVPQEKKDSIDNILLLCHSCHKTIDDDPVKYTTGHLQKLKLDFEKKIEAQTSPGAEDCRKMIIFTAEIFGKRIGISEEEAIDALWGTGQYPLGHAALVEVPHLLRTEESPKFWEDAVAYIDEAFITTLKYHLCEDEKLAIFGFAPQPLLVYFGWKLGEAMNKQVFQRHSDQQSVWSWPKSPADMGQLLVTEPSADNLNNVNDATPLAISFSISFDIRERVAKEIPADSLHWDVKPEKGCCTEYVQSPEKLSEFRALVHQLLDRVSKVGSKQPIHIFLSMPVSMAITLGMSIMRKATNDIILHDYVKSQDLDVEAITINLCQ